MDLFEQEGIERVLSAHYDLSAPDLAKAILRAATEWAKGHLRDDAAVVVVERL